MWMVVAEERNSISGYVVLCTLHRLCSSLTQISSSCLLHCPMPLSFANCTFWICYTLAVQLYLALEKLSRSFGEFATSTMSRPDLHLPISTRPATMADHRHRIGGPCCDVRLHNIPALH
ncbi:hypothetical protein NEOLEDRAFT_340800 [Neolentinus lepideus HHB14362 ss-1]|uniref:Uncharacterized protein n=1 Tax=Neolentinus lepideus HHB14362 ss-1 TaxID=1314782 RepID=A0A165SWS3_9AGAM|nr:hypothetical protein NEOLEDRAFT_340800 [Neolentinus lepideus HHB14362 ss-1]